MYSEAVSGPCIVPPPPDMKLIIDKMADYVARNGPEFEIVVRRRNDDRFRFVEAGHPHHAYYLHKKDAFLHVSILAVSPLPPLLCLHRRFNRLIFPRFYYVIRLVFITGLLSFSLVAV